MQTRTATTTVRTSLVAGVLAAAVLLTNPAAADAKVTIGNEGVAPTVMGVSCTQPASAPDVARAFIHGHTGGPQEL